MDIYIVNAMNVKILKYNSNKIILVLEGAIVGQNL